MQIDVDRALVDFEGKPIIGSDQQPTTLRTVLRNALGMQAPNEQVSGEEKLKRFEIGMLVGKGGSVELDTGQIQVCKHCIAMHYSPLVSGQVWMLLEGKGDLLPKG